MPIPICERGSLGRRDAALYLGISLRNLDVLASLGQLKRLKVGTKTLFRVRDLEQFLDRLASKSEGGDQ